MTTDITGLRKAVTKQLDLTIAEYTGIAREGDLVIDCNDGPTQYQLFVGTSTGNLTPVSSGGGGGDANYANYAGNVVNSSQPNITSVGTLTSLTVSGDILPSANITYNLGSPTQRFDSIYLSNNTIFLGAAELSVDSGANLTVDGLPVATTSNTGDLSVSSINVNGNALVAGNLTVSGNTFYIDVTALQIEDPIIAVGGGANGAPLTTNDGKDRGMQLHVYDTGLSAEIDKFIGWDNSGGEFILGSNVTISSDVVTVNEYGNVRANIFFGNIVGVLANGISNVEIPVVDSNVIINAATSAWEFDTTGNITAPDGAVIGDTYNDNLGFGIQAPPVVGGYAIMNSSDLEQYVQVDNGAIYMGVNYGLPGGNQTWRFDPTLLIYFPDGSTQSTAWLGNNLQTNQFFPAFSPSAGAFLTSNGSSGFSYSSSNVVVSGTGLVADSLTTRADTSAAVALDLATSDLFVRTITSATTLSISNAPANGKVGSFILQITDAGTNVTFWPNIRWASGTPPTLTVAGTDVLGFYTYDGGTSWVGLVLALDIS